jgi:hypothetical protein
LPHAPHLLTSDLQGWGTGGNRSIICSFFVARMFG